MVSIVIPTLNEERYIGALLDSLAGQTHRDFEVIIVDGGSSCSDIPSRIYGSGHEEAGIMVALLAFLGHRLDLYLYHRVPHGSNVI